MILDNEHSYGMPVILLQVELCQNCIISLIKFVYVVLASATILSLQRVLLLFMSNGGVMLLIFWRFGVSGCDWP